SIVLTSRPTLLGSDVLPFDKSKFVQALEKGGYERSPLSSCHATEKPNHRHLLPARRDWPRRRRTAEQRDELASLHRCNHSITSLAAASRLSGTVRPSILAVEALITSSNLLDCTPGRSAGFAPLRMRPVYTPMWRYASPRFGP